jgi:hypothetical protein
MTAVLPTTAVGVFRDRDQAEGALADLRRAGFRDDQIGVAGRQEQAPADAATEAPGTRRPVACRLLTCAARIGQRQPGK